MIDRAGGWMEWSGLVKGRAGAGDRDGDWGGGGERGRGVTTVLWGLRCNDDGIVCLLSETTCFVKYIIVDSVVVVVVVVVATMAGGRWWWW